MIEPLPKLRSIWESAASRAFDLSMEAPSTRRNAVLIAPTPYRTGFAGPTTNGQRGSSVHDLFSVRNMFFFAARVLARPVPAARALSPPTSRAVGADQYLAGRAEIFGVLISWNQPRTEPNAMSGFGVPMLDIGIALGLALMGFALGYGTREVVSYLRRQAARERYRELGLVD